MFTIMPAYVLGLRLCLNLQRQPCGIFVCASSAQGSTLLRAQWSPVLSPLLLTWRQCNHLWWWGGTAQVTLGWGVGGG